MAKKVLRGRGMLTQMRCLMEQLQVSRPLLVCGNTLAQTFHAATGMWDIPRFSGYHANPDFMDCTAGAQMYRDHSCDGLISIGGGSAMDTAKGIKAMLLASSPEAALAYAFSQEEIPHIAVPATAGTGAEATQFAVVYLNNEKHSLSHPALLPEGVVLDADLLDSLPAYHKKSCALDALCQGIESYWAAGATPASRVDAALAIRGVLDHIRPYLAGEKAAAEGLLEASWRSGEAIQVSRTTAAHAMSYKLTKTFGIAHGHACALTLPILWEMLQEDETQLTVLQELAAIMRLDDYRQGSRLLRSMLMELDMEAPAAPDPAVIDRLAASVNAERLGNHPQKLTQAQLREVYARTFKLQSDEERQACLDVWKSYGHA